MKLDLSRPLEKEHLLRSFSVPVTQVWLEIGFGAGEHLTWQARNHPDTGILGAEPYLNGVVAAISALESAELDSRVRIHAGDALPVLEWLPPQTLTRAFLLFPDPWPKKRHRARRLLSPMFLDKLARVLAPQSEFRFASDIPDYAEEAIDHANAHPAFDIERVFTSTNRATVPDWPVTRYERKADKAGRPSTFIVMRRKV